MTDQPATETLAPWLVKALYVLHRPRGWRVIETKRLSGLSSQDRVIRCPFITDVYGMWTFLHECGHVNLLHFGARCQAAHVEEWEAEVYARRGLQAFGVRAPRWLEAAGKKYVEKTVAADVKLGSRIDMRVIRWIG